MAIALAIIMLRQSDMESTLPLSEPVSWPTADTSRIPFAVYTDESLHRKELERFFYQGHWCFVGLEE